MSTDYPYTGRLSRWEELAEGLAIVGDLVLLHGVSHDYDLAWREQLETLAASGGFPLRYAGTVSRPKNCPDWHGLTGRVESIIVEQLDEHRLTPDNATIYLCGNPDMIAAVEETATARGFPPEQV